MGHGAIPVDVGAVLGSGVRVSLLLELLLVALGVIALLHVASFVGWLLDVIEWLRGLLR